MALDDRLPLGGVRIVDCTIRHAGPATTQLLADMGAEVIKVEAPAGGDPSRGPTRDAGTWMTLPHGLPYHFEVLNRGKKSIVVDLTKEEGKQIVYSLVAKSNVFVQNFRHGVTERLGIDYKTLQKYNASLVYANLSGYGSKGKRASEPALDPAIHAASGTMLGMGEPDMPPIHLHGAMCDQITAIMLAYAIMVALFYQERTGIGQEVNVAMLGTMVWVQTVNILFTLMNKKSRERHCRAKTPNPLVNHYRCKDGRWIQLAMFSPDTYWSPLCRGMGLEELIDDPRFSSLMAREQNSAELISILDSVFDTKTRDEWLDILPSEDLIYSPILDYWEVVNDPQVLENDFIVEFEHPSLGKLKEIGIPLELSKAPRSIRGPAPQLGQHTEEVLIEILGFSWEEIEGLRDRGVIL